MDTRGGNPMDELSAFESARFTEQEEKDEGQRLHVEIGFKYSVWESEIFLCDDCNAEITYLIRNHQDRPSD
ncbi:hypothetical protein V7S43_005523 [Phytophthora oleae]|uniref:Uncharacterized protein n=1 Tax=Phytophthora oleae TaxID=2107226 RepID=A0ABD3FVX2_9STRA